MGRKRSYSVIVSNNNKTAMMTSSDEFSLPCESNSSMEIYPKNTSAHFTINMREPLELNEQWEVALSEFQYPCAWYNMREGNNRFLIRWRFQQNVGEKPYSIWKRVPAGYYADTASLVNKIRELIENYAIGKLQGVKIDYNELTQRVTIETKNVTFIKNQSRKEYEVVASIKLKGDVSRLLGFPKDKLIAGNREVTSPFTATPTGGFHQMYVYSDVIQPQPHPDGNVPVLRVIAVEHEREQRRYASIHFQQPYYMTLSKSRINSIEFKIADATGESVGFSHGNVVITLLFRRKPIRVN